MNNTSFQRIKDIIAGSDKLAVAVGANPTVDEMAAALSLYLSLGSLQKRVSIACPTDPIVELNPLVGIDKVKNLFEGEGGDLVVSFPYREGEIEKVSYTIDNGFLNIVVKAGEEGLSFEESDVKYTRGAETPQLMFVVGTPRLANLGGLYNPEEQKDVTIINIDNKQDNQGFGDIVLVSPKFSSVSEQVADLLLALGIDFDVDVAQNLLYGVSEATGNFQDPNTSYLAFEIAAILMKKGAVRNRSFAGSPRREERRDEQRRQDRPQEERRFDRRDQNQSQQQPRRDDRGQQSQRRDDRQGDRRDNRDMRREERPQQSFQNAPTQSDQDRDEATRRELSQIMRQGQSQTQGQSQPQPVEQPSAQPEPVAEDTKAPEDWLRPRVYKGSTNV